MQEMEKEKGPGISVPKTITLPLGKTAILFAVVLLGLLLVVIGPSIENEGVYYAGAFILPAALFWAGLFLKEESGGVRITLLAIGGYLVAALLTDPTPIISRSITSHLFE